MTDRRLEASFFLDSLEEVLGCARGIAALVPEGDPAREGELRETLELAERKVQHLRAQIDDWRLN